MDHTTHSSGEVYLLLSMAAASLLLAGGLVGAVLSGAAPVIDTQYTLHASTLGDLSVATGLLIAATMLLGEVANGALTARWG